jgi:hypothetical protein
MNAPVVRRIHIPPIRWQRRRRNLPHSLGANDRQGQVRAEAHPSHALHPRVRKPPGGDDFNISIPEPSGAGSHLRVRSRISRFGGQVIGGQRKRPWDKGGASRPCWGGAHREARAAALVGRTPPLPLRATRIGTLRRRHDYRSSSVLAFSLASVGDGLPHESIELGWPGCSWCLTVFRPPCVASVLTRSQSS